MDRINIGYRIDQYEVVAFLQEGVCATTYRLLSDEGESAFLKVYDPSLMRKEMLQGDEVKAICCHRNLEHKNLARYITDGKVCINGNSYHYIITEYLSGGLLSDMIEREGPLPVEQALGFALDIADALNYLHGQGLVHNDVTPRNIMFDAEDGCLVAKLIDMGHLSTIQQSGHAPFQTSDLDPLFRSPYAVTGCYNATTDLFSLAAVLFTMLQGKAPWWMDFSKVKDKAIATLRFAKKRKTEPLEITSSVPEYVQSAILTVLYGVQGENFGIEDFVNAIKGIRPVAAPAPRIYTTSKRTFTPEESEKPQQPAKPTTHRMEDKQAPDFAPRRGKGFADVVGMEEVKDILNRQVIFVLKNKEKARRYKITPPNGILLYGPPGCGKTFIAEKFAEESGFNFVYVKASDIGSYYQHQTENIIADLFEKAAKNAPAIIFFDEFDSMAPDRGGMGREHQATEVNEFLVQLNNCSRKGIFVIAATNRLDMIDSAVMRKGRLDKCIYVPHPTREVRRSLFANYLKDRPTLDIDLDALADATELFVSSDISYIANDAALTAAFLDEPITQEMLMNSIRCTVPSLNHDKLLKYTKLRQEIENGKGSVSSEHRIGFKLNTQ